MNISIAISFAFMSACLAQQVGAELLNPFPEPKRPLVVILGSAAESKQTLEQWRKLCLDEELIDFNCSIREVREDTLDGQEIGPYLRSRLL